MNLMKSKMLSTKSLINDALIAICNNFIHNFKEISEGIGQ